jgi:F0F1-type ATP synthase assembly protein I
MVAHSGLFGEKFRYVLSHIMLMASFQALRSSRLRPPLVMGLFSTSLVILGEESSSQMKLFVMW